MGFEAGKSATHLTGHIDAINALAFSPDKRVLLTGGQDGIVCFWNLTTAQSSTIHRHRVPVAAISISVNGNLAISGGNNSILTLYQVKTGELLRTMTGRVTSIRSIAFHATGDFASGGQDGIIQLWADSAVITGNPKLRLSGHSGAVCSLCFSPTGWVLASGGSDRLIQLWNSNGELLSTLTGHTNSVLSLTFSADGQTLFSSSSDRTIKLWRR